MGSSTRFASRHATLQGRVGDMKRESSFPYRATLVVRDSSNNLLYISFTVLLSVVRFGRSR